MSLIKRVWIKVLSIYKYLVLVSVTSTYIVTSTIVLW